MSASAHHPITCRTCKEYVRKKRKLNSPKFYIINGVISRLIMNGSLQWCPHKKMEVH